GEPQRAAYTVGDTEVAVAYRYRRGVLDVRVDDAALGEVVVASATPDLVVLEVDGVRRRYTVTRADGVSYVDGPDGSVALVEVPRFADPNAAAAAGSLLAPMPGGVVRVLAEAGASVTAGQPLVVLEAMKMEHTVAAPVDGIVSEIHVAQGDQVDTGQVLAVVDEVAEEAAAG
ncbi:biotin/lipoyl-containing protein, partial [Pseudonocardia sp. SCN 73-27]